MCLRIFFFFCLQERNNKFAYIIIIDQIRILYLRIDTLLKIGRKQRFMCDLCMILVCILYESAKKVELHYYCASGDCSCNYCALDNVALALNRYHFTKPVARLRFHFNLLIAFRRYLSSGARNRKGKFPFQQSLKKWEPVAASAFNG